MLFIIVYSKFTFQQKVVEEQRKIFSGNINAHVTASDLQDMKYLDLVIKETLRLYPSVPLIGRELPEDLKWSNMLYQMEYHQRNFYSLRFRW